MRRNEGMRLLAGTEELRIRVRPPFDTTVVAFLGELGQQIFERPGIRAFPDIVTFAFWCRRGHLEKLKRSYPDIPFRLGRGLAFHIAPSNIPINFAYTYAFGLLSGNSNAVRVSSKEFSQTEIVCGEVKKLFQKERYKEIREETQILSYPYSKNITDLMSAQSMLRLIWGGDQTIQELRKSPLPPRGSDIVFADRYSIGILSAEEIVGMEEWELSSLAHSFYNDTYLMDQNACSSPYMIFWEDNSKETLKRAKERFWKAVADIAEKKYDLTDKKASEKYTTASLYAARAMTGSLKRYKNVLYVAQLDHIPDRLDEFRGKFGLFFEVNLDDKESFKKALTPKIQTLSCSLGQCKRWRQWVLEEHLTGIDRVVPYGHTLELGLVWDGYDLISQMTRLIDGEWR